MCSILPNAMHLDEQGLVERCLNIIDSQTKSVLSSQSFLSISREILATIIQRDTLVGANEYEIFCGCVKWALKQCERNGWEHNTTNRREALGNVLHLIRFPLMSLEVFSNQVTTAGLLNKDECLSVFLYLTRKNSNLSSNENPPFPQKKRVSNPSQQNKVNPYQQICPGCSYHIQKGYMVRTVKSCCPNCGTGIRFN